MAIYKSANERHRQVQTAFYGLMILAVTVYGLIGLELFQKWHILGYRYNFFNFCWVFFKSHIWHMGVMFLLLVLLILMSFNGGKSFWDQYRDSRRLVKRIAQLSVSMPADLRVMCQKYQLTGKLLLTCEREPYAFVYGLLSPRIVISQGLVDIMDRDELLAVLLHEKYHMMNYDPLRIIIGRTVVKSLFFIPLAGKIFEGFNSARELAADAMAISLQGNSLGLALALRKLLSKELSLQPELPAVGIMGIADLRIAQLIREGGPVQIQIASRRQVTLTIGIMAFLLMLCISGCA